MGPTSRRQSKESSSRAQRRCCSLSWFILLEITADNVLGYFLTMLNEGQVHVMNTGESLTLECGFRADGYNLFDYPVLWRKVQKDEETQVNIMGNINEPFVSTNRFEVAFSSSPPKHKLELSILDIAQEDSGNYTCEVRGPQSFILGQLTYYLFVRAPVSNIVVSLFNISDRSSSTPQRVIHLTEGVPSTLRCVAFGGYPPPSLDLFIGIRDVTRDFRFFHSAVMTGRRGLRTINYRTERFASTFLAPSSDDGATLRCISKVPGLKPYTEYVRFSVDYSPKVFCLPTDAFLGEKNVNIRCDVKSKPKLSAMFWIIDSNGTALAEGEVINGLWTLAVDRPDGSVEVQLFMRQAKPEFFRKYTIVAENNVAVETVDVVLNQKHRSTVAMEIATAGHVFGRSASHDNRRKDYIDIQNGGSRCSLMASEAAQLTVTMLLGLTVGQVIIAVICSTAAAAAGGGGVRWSSLLLSPTGHEMLLLLNRT